MVDTEGTRGAENQGANGTGREPSAPDDDSPGEGILGRLNIFQIFQPEIPHLALTGRPELRYLPIVDIGNGRLLGFEALIRWVHPTRGVVGPRELLPWVEANGMTSYLGDWVILQACCEAMRWPSSLQIGINCSFSQVLDGSARKSIDRAQRETGINLDRVTLEVSERTLGHGETLRELASIADMGVHLALDDVGTGWTSLDEASRYRVDTVKIDRVFISELQAERDINHCIVEALVDLGHASRMTIVAEGVETTEQLSLLSAMKVDAAEGFFFTEPMSAKAAERLANSSEVVRYSLQLAGTLAEEGHPE